ncbi:unnamed protein product, partial [Citrullus colocynthis]
MVLQHHRGHHRDVLGVVLLAKALHAYPLLQIMIALQYHMIVPQHLPVRCPLPLACRKYAAP